jgi:hypothetical protein
MPIRRSVKQTFEKKVHKVCFESEKLSCQVGALLTEIDYEGSSLRHREPSMRMSTIRRALDSQPGRDVV